MEYNSRATDTTYTIKKVRYEETPLRDRELNFVVVVINKKVAHLKCLAPRGQVGHLSICVQPGT